MKIVIKYNEIPNTYIGKFPHLKKIENNLFTYDVSDDFIRDFNFHLAGAEQTNFTTLLIHLIFKADMENIYKLAEGYPAECLTIAMYKNVPGFYKQVILDRVDLKKA